MSGRRTGKAPGRGWYALGCLPVVLGLVAFVSILVAQLPKMDDGLEQIVVPGARELRLEPGEHTVFLEHRSVVNGKTYVVDQISGLAVKVEAADGTALAIRDPSGSATYQLGGREGQAIHVFTVEQGGTYRVSADYDGGLGPETVIAVGQGFLSGLMVTVFSAIGSIFLGLALSVAVVVGVYLVRRRRVG